MNATAIERLIAFARRHETTADLALALRHPADLGDGRPGGAAASGPAGAVQHGARRAAGVAAPLASVGLRGARRRRGRAVDRRREGARRRRAAGRALHRRRRTSRAAAPCWPRPCSGWAPCSPPRAGATTMRSRRSSGCRPDDRRRRSRARACASATAYQSPRSRSARRAAERARIAREMHDIVAHNLSVMIALADGAVFAAEQCARAARRRRCRPCRRPGGRRSARCAGLLGVLRDDGRRASCCRSRGCARSTSSSSRCARRGCPWHVAVEGDGARAARRGAADRVPPRPGGAHQLAQARRRPAARRACACATTRRASTSRSATTAPARARTARADTGSGSSGMRERAAVYAGTRRGRPAAAGGWRVHAHLAVEQLRRQAAMTTSVLLVDDQPLLRIGFRMVLESQDDLVRRGRGGRRRGGRAPDRRARPRRRADGRAHAGHGRHRGHAPDRRRWEPLARARS